MAIGFFERLLGATCRRFRSCLALGEFTLFFLEFALASVNPVGCIKLIEYVRELEVALGDGVKRITPEEEETRTRLGVRTACALSAT